MRVRMSFLCRLIPILAAGTCFLSLLGADLDAGHARIALYQPAGQKEDMTLAAVLRTVADSIELSLDLLQRYEVTRLSAADPAADLDKVRAYCQENRIDQAILGSGVARPGGGYRFRLVVYDRKTDKITTDRQGTSNGVLDMFEVTDALVASLLDSLSGTHLLFGSLSVESDPAGATVSVNGKDVGAAPLSLRGLPVGVVTLSARMDGREVARALVTIADGETTGASLKLPPDLPALFKLVANGAPQDVQAVIKQGANIKAMDNDGRTVLSYAASSNQNPEVITTLLKAGADLTATTKDGRTALMWAASSNPNPEVITTFLKAGADVNVHGQNGMTPLGYAAAGNTPAVITTLLRAGADVNAQYGYGHMTPLMLAAVYNQNPEVITVLLNAGADAKAKGGPEVVAKTAYDFALSNRKLKGTDALKQLLEAAVK